MGSSKFSLHSAVYVMLEKDNQVLMLRRHNTGWEDGKYTLPAGHLDGGESVKTAAIREAKEEIGVDISEDDLEVVHILHAITNFEYITFFLKANKWIGTPTNVETEKSDDLQWFSIDAFPDNTLKQVTNFFNNYKKGIIFSEEGFEKFDPTQNIA
ncbi:MAG TPA: NUDIX domain-containing protein [Candidatus Levybacteria bacterium]|nr:NUDIX domain-containing protein [Candidatus Levybacteria bacterium]